MIGKRGVVINDSYRQIAIKKVREWFKINGWIDKEVLKSPITGAAGNKEYFIYCEK